MKNNLPEIRTKMARIEKLFAALNNPDIYCYISDLSSVGTTPSVAFFQPQHSEIIAALGPNEWKRELSSTGKAFHYVRHIFGVRVELTDAQPNVSVPLFAAEVDPALLTGREAGIALGPNAVRDVHPAADPANVAPAILAAATAL